MNYGNHLGKEIPRREDVGAELKDRTSIHPLLIFLSSLSCLNFQFYKVFIEPIHPPLGSISPLKLTHPNVENMIVVLIVKRMVIIMSIKVCLISWININYKDNGSKKTFSCKSKASSVSQCGELDCSANKKKNEDYYEYPSLSHFMNEHYL